MRRLLPTLLVLLLTLGGCASQEIQRKDGKRTAREFSVANLAKTDVDVMAEFSQREMLQSLRLLTEKLYRRNPQEFRKTGLGSPEAAAERIFGQLPKWQESTLAVINWEDNFRITFQEDYAGDRVYAFMSALTTMLMASYNHKREFFLPDELSAQKLFNSARNIEVAVWKLSNARLASGARVLVSNSMDPGDVANLSFEREFGKLIAHQDLLALVIEDRGNRTISRAFQGVTSFVFLPI